MSKHKPAEFIECRYCEWQCKYRTIAEKNMKEDEKYTQEFFNLYRNGDLDAVAIHIAKEAITIMETDDLESLLALSLCLYVVGANELEIPKIVRRRLGRLAKSKLRTSIREELILLASEESFSEPITPIIKEAPVRRKKVLKPIISDSAADMIISIPDVVEELEELPAVDLLENWLKSDKVFIEYVDKILIQSDDVLEVKFDLETEGFLQRVIIKILFSYGDSSGEPIIKLEIQSPIDVSYHSNVVIGKTSKGMWATTVPGELNDENLLYQQLEGSAHDEGQDQDPLILMINRDRYLMKTINNALILKSPNESESRSIKIPIYIQRKNNRTCSLILKTFFKESMSPSDLFIIIMDGIAENLDYLLELPAEKRAEVLLKDTSWFSIRGKSSIGSFSSKFIQRVTLPDIPTCSHCSRPLPQDTSGSSQRCPFCYEKL